MKKDYDEGIRQHYRGVAEKHGMSLTSTMEDEITRNFETDAIIQFVSTSLMLRQIAGLSGTATIMDVGCGNGFTLDVLSREFPGHTYVGIEKSDELRSLASLRISGKKNAKILEGDIRERGFAKDVIADILICQRVLINLLDVEDQRQALNNILASVKSSSNCSMGSTLLFIESFINPLKRLNEARSEFELLPIPPACHNLYLTDDFFETPQLKPLEADGLSTPPNFLSSHYYVTRVLHEVFTRGKPFKRNSEFVGFFTRALNQNIGDYAPLKLYMFKKTEEN